MRDFKSAFTPNQLQSMQKGLFGNFKYKGLPCLKCPVDLAIYMKLLWDVKPKTIIEIGSKFGGSAAFFSDICNNFSLDTQIVSIDLSPPNDLEIENVVFIEGDASTLDLTFSKHDIYALARPWLIIEDSAHTYEVCLKVLSFFSQHLNAGEYLIMEDGILDELGLSENYNGGPNRAIRHYLSENLQHYFIDEYYCDMYGTNFTYNPNGYLRKA